MWIQEQQQKRKPSSAACTKFPIESQLLLTTLAIYSFVKKHRATFSLLQHIKRANYQAYVWRKALVPRQDLPTPAGNGWTIQGNSLFPNKATSPREYLGAG